MFDKIRENPAISVFAGMTCIQTVICIAWLFGQGKLPSDPMWILGFLMTVSALLFACRMFKVSLWFALFVITGPFTVMTVFGVPRTAVITAASVIVSGLFFYLWRKKKKGPALLTGLIFLVFFVFTELYYVNSPALSADTAFPYLLYEKTGWPHFFERGYRFGEEDFLEGYMDLVRDADMSPLRLRTGLKPVLDGLYGESAGDYYMSGALFSVGIGTKTALTEFVTRLLLLVFAPLSFYVVLIFRIPDTFVPAFILDLTAGGALTARLWLTVFGAIFMAVIAGGLVKRISRSGVRGFLASFMPLLAVTFLTAVFLWFFRLPAFDVRDTGLIFVLHGIYWTKALTDTEDGTVN